MRNHLVSISAGAVALAMAAAVASAGSVALGTSGWTANWSSDLDGRISVNTDAVSDDAVYIEKFVNFTTNDPVRILFQQTPGESAVSNIVINDEQLANRSGQDWSGFTMSLVGVAGNATFDVAKSNVGQSGGFSIDPFTSSAFSDGDTVLTVGGGVVPSQPVGQNVWFPGSGAGALWTVHPTTEEGGLLSFILTEQPITSTLIPLPAAFWSGLAGLAGLGALAIGKRIRKA